MIYLTTGTNGAGKTLLTLWDVRQQQLKENRPVYFRGFTANAMLFEWGWQEFEAEKWQELPDGSICIWDEAQEKLGTDLGKELPDWVMAIAKYRRKRGMDFWIVTPHPMMLHTFVRRLVEKPSWHRHLKRAFGADLVSELRYSYVETQCERPGSGDQAQITMVPYRKEVYPWYQSASLHTAKRKIPRAVWVALLAFPLAGLAGWYGLSTVMNFDKRAIAKLAPGTPALGSAPGQLQLQPGSGNSPGASPKPVPMTPAELADSYRPRFPGLPWTAARYDQVTQPTEAPYPAACIDGVRPGSKVRECRCFSQQATLLPATPAEMCRQIAREGFYLDWKQAPAAAGAAPGRPVASASAAVPAGPVIFKGDHAGTYGGEWLASAEDNSPVVGKALESSGLLGQPSESELRAAAAVRGMRSGQRAW